MSIPGGISVPGAELVLRARALAPNPATRIIVNCAGRTRSIIGTQSLVNAGLPNPVAALRNGTIGWTLAGQALDHGASRRFAEVTPGSAREAASAGARRGRPRRRAARPVRRPGALCQRGRPHHLPLRRAHARGIRRRPPAGLSQRARRPAGAGNRRVGPGARRAHRAGRRRRRARQHDRVLAGADWAGTSGCSTALQAGDFSETGPAAGAGSRARRPHRHTHAAELARWLRDDRPARPPCWT